MGDAHVSPGVTPTSPQDTFRAGVGEDLEEEEEKNVDGAVKAG
jgi:hypothetical protein